MAGGSQGFSLSQGAFIGSYRVIEPIGRNALGEKYLVRSSKTRRNCMLTIVDSALSGREGLLGDLEALAGMENPAIARIDMPEQDRGLTLVPAEFVEGIGGGQVTLADELDKKGGALSEDTADPLLRSLISALGYAHAYQGAGICHGSLTPQAIAMTKQGHPRILDFGFSALAGEATVAGDLQALGRVMAAVTGGKGRWQARVAGCAGAGTPAGYAEARDVLAAMDQAEQKRGRMGMGALLAILVVVAAAVGIGFAVVVKSRGPKGKEQVAGEQAETSPKKAVDSAKINQNLAAAEQAWAKAKPDLARSFLKKVLADDPANSRALKLVGDLDTEAGMAKVGVVKDKADRAWGRARQLDAVPSFAPQLAQLGTQYKSAGSAFSGMDFDTAEKRYRSFVKAAEALLALDDTRKAALKLKDEVEDAYDRAQDEEAAKYAKADWEFGLKQREAGKIAMQAADFPAARQARQEALVALKNAARRATGLAQVELAKKGYDLENDYADEDLLAAVPKAQRDRVTRLAARAGDLCRKEQFEESAESWQKAALELDLALKEAAKKAGDQAPTIAAAKGERSHGELAMNGDLEKGRGGQPEGWSTLDGLTAKWSTKGKPGRCLAFDTGVLQVDKARYLKEIGQAEKLGKNATLTEGVVDANAGENFKRSKGGQYATVGAHEGVWAFATPIPVAPGDEYFVVEVDCLGPAKSTPLFYPQVFVRGFQKFDPKRDAGRSSWFHVPHQGGPAFSEQFGSDDQRRRARLGDYLMVYRHSLVCRNKGPNIWEHYQMAFEMPKEKRFRPDVLLLKAYAMWPLGVYRFDNLRLRSVDKAEFDEVKKNRHSIKGFMPTE
ncbi:MAG: hypothetical protein HN849_30575 [Victivallales bacterium]|nr:hypothetical protein [Victivallales bacterium]MBT7303917.1 hypothetical protein [Victivallales bacterium]